MSSNSALSFAVAVLLSASTAMAQSPPENRAETSSDSSSEGSLQEVVVTAERRASTAQTTPIAMEVFDNAALEAQGVVDPEGLTTITPGLSFKNVGGEATLSLRGISSNDTTEIGDPAVVIANDGFFVNRPYTLLYGFYDLSRVEVLKGPQGTLYGRNAVGGVINILSARPEDSFSGRLAVTYGNYNTVNVEGMVNVPLTDWAEVRTSFLTQRHDGYRNTPVVGEAGVIQKGDDQDSQSVRVELALHPGEHFRALLTEQFLHAGGVGSVENEIPWAFDSQGFLVLNKPNLGSARTFTVQAPSSLDTTDYQTRWEVSYDALPFGITATYTGGYDKVDWQRLNDVSPLNTPTDFHQSEFPITQNHEFRLSSAPNQRLIWQAGVFYFLEDSTLDSYVETLAGAPQVSFNFPTLHTTSRAIFGQASYNITDTLKFTAGARYTEDSKLRNGTFSLDFFAPPVVLSQYGRADSSRTTYHGALDWSPTQENMVYAKFDTGYKAGGFNSGGATPGGYDSYAPETLKAYEIGSKNRFWDRKLEVNLAAFHYDYYNLQTLEFIPSFATGSIVTNAEKATVNGVELQSAVLLDPVGKFDAEIDYLQARYSNFVAAPVEPMNPAVYPSCTGPLTAQNCQLRGNTLPYSPHISLTAGLVRVFDLSANGKITADVHTHILTKQYFDGFNLDATSQKSYTDTNLNVSYEPNKGNRTLSFYIHNIENAAVLTDAEFYGAGGTDAYFYGYAPPRTLGVKFEQRF